MPNQKHYVTMTDTAMSGWGRADGRINKLIFECESDEEAMIVYRNAKARDEMQYVHIWKTKPRYNKNRYLAQYKTKSESSRWYVENYFKDKKGVSE